MAYRCINAFSTESRTVAHGAEIEDDDPILKTHAEHFSHVHIPMKPGIETATAGTRSKPGPKPKAKPVEPTLPDADEALRVE